MEVEFLLAFFDGTWDWRSYIVPLPIDTSNEELINWWFTYEAAKWNTDEIVLVAVYWKEFGE